MKYRLVLVLQEFDDGWKQSDETGAMTVITGGDDLKDMSRMHQDITKVNMKENVPPTGPKIDYDTMARSQGYRS